MIIFYLLFRLALFGLLVFFLFSVFISLMLFFMRRKIRHRMPAPDTENPAKESPWRDASVEDADFKEIK